MGIEELVLEQLHALPPDKQREVLDFAEFLRRKAGVSAPYRSIKGLWADLGAQLMPQDIEDVRREMWDDFPREDVP